LSEVEVDDFVALPFEGVQATQAAAFDAREFFFDAVVDGEGSGLLSSISSPLIICDARDVVGH
jgi:hypothetical protein